ncbi:hypothetical protein DLREEDagrD3_22820 [Denitratisoma sp. agr-D3]
MDVWPSGIVSFPEISSFRRAGIAKKEGGVFKTSKQEYVAEFKGLIVKRVRARQGGVTWGLT